MSIARDRRTNKVLLALEEISEELATMRQEVDNLVTRNYQDGYHDGYDDCNEEIEQEEAEK